MTTVLLEIKDNIATLTLNRPERHNAFDDVLIAEMTAHLQALHARTDLRAVILRSAGKSFSAGGDLNWMQRMSGFTRAENIADAKTLAELLYLLDTLPAPTLALVQGACYGGGVGLAGCADIVIAEDTASFCLSEVRLGLIAAVISPYVTRALGVRQMRRVLLTAEVMPAAFAKELGLVHEVVPAGGLQNCAAGFLETMRANSPAAMRQAKALVRAVAHRPIDEAVVQQTAEYLADARASADGREGITAFLEKRKPRWVK